MTKKAVLFLHGFSARVEDNQAFIDYMQKKIRIDFYTVILPGHETKRMGKVTHQDWIDASETKLKELLNTYRQITIVGHSMGTILAIYLAAHYPQVEKLVLVSPAYIFGNLEQNTRDFKKILKHEIDPNVGTGFEGVLHKLFYVPFTRFFEYKKLVKRSKEAIRKVTCPTLILHGTMDNVIPLHSSLYVYNMLNCEKHLTLLEHVRHQVFKSKKARLISHYIYDYIVGGMQFQIKKKDII